MVYKWRPGFRYAQKADPAKVAEELNGGQITPEEALDIAKDAKTELHKCVTWDLKKAARQYQLAEMRNTINHLVTVEVEIRADGTKHDIFMPIFESIPTTTGQRYCEAQTLDTEGLNYILARKGQLVASIAAELRIYSGRRKSMKQALSKLDEAREALEKATEEKDIKSRKKKTARKALLVATT